VGAALYLASTKGTETKRYLLDFGYTGDALNANLELLKIDLTSTDALILSHGHLDHVGGLLEFLKKHRDTMKADLKLYLGGEDAFCQRMQKQDDGSFLPWGRLDRSDLKAARVQPVLSELPIIVEGHAFTTGAVPRVSMEKVLPNSFVCSARRMAPGVPLAHTPSTISRRRNCRAHRCRISTCMSTPPASWSGIEGSSSSHRAATAGSSTR
jgi:7,8-dihydropterin-6-yl-methyl-4-(beta-D-ribofuranosyl)aminobenzene 5'-phosphate synthase